MSAYTSALLYLSGPPPLVTTGEVAGFIDGLDRLDLLEERKCASANLKFGTAINQDDDPIFTEVELLPPVIFTCEEITWDVQLHNASLPETATWLRSLTNNDRHPIQTEDSSPIYRADFTFGALKEEIYRTFSRELPHEEGGNLWLDHLSMTFAPVELHNLHEPAIYLVGYISISIHGFGSLWSLWPWTYEDTLARVKGSKPLQRLYDLCRATWSVVPVVPPPEIIAMRRQMGNLWGDDIEAPDDWRWTIDETY